MTLLCVALASSIAACPASAQTEVADLREDVRGLTQRVGELSLRVEQLEHENAKLSAKVGSLGDNRGYATSAELNGAVADLNASIKSAVDTSRTEILEHVATQMENLAKQTNAALDSIARPAAAAPTVAAQSGAPRAAANESGPRSGSSYTVQKGDSVGLIAKKTGARVQDIIEANSLADPSRIQAGQVLVIPAAK